MKIKNIFRFKGINNLYFDIEENQFYFKEKPVKKIWNNGTISVLCGQKKYGLISLRKLYYHDKLIIENLPF